MKRNLLIISAVFIAVIVMMLISDIVVVGDKLASIPKIGTYCKYSFYLLILSCALLIVVFPVIKLVRTPQMPAMTTKGLDENSLRVLGKSLASNFDYIEDKGKRNEKKRDFVDELNHSYNLEDYQECIGNELKNRFEGNEELGVKGINYLIKQYAQTVFMVTAISPSSKVDSVSALVLNFTMIKNMVRATGFRPTNVQMGRLYFRVLLTALFSYSVSEALKDVGGIAPFKFLEGSATDGVVDADLGDADTESFSLSNMISRIKIPGAVIGPIIDGITNALMTLRIGYVTKSYLEEGRDGFMSKRADLKRDAIADAFIAMPGILKNSSSNFKGLAGKAVEYFADKYESYNEKSESKYDKSN